MPKHNAKSRKCWCVQFPDGVCESERLTTSLPKLKASPCSSCASHQILSQLQEHNRKPNKNRACRKHSLNIQHDHKH